MLERGDVLAGTFEIEHLVENEGRVAAYRARHLHTGRRARLKHFSLDGSWTQTLAEQSERMMTVVDDAWPTCLGAGPHGRKRWFFAFEWEPGNALEAELAAPLSVERVVLLGRQISGALAALHEADLVHGRVRPEQIVLAQRRAGAIKLLDSVCDPELPVLAPQAAFLAPELVRGDGPSFAADVYALGVLLTRALAGKVWQPAEGRLGTFLATLFGLRPRAARTPPGLASWLARMMAHDPLHRPEARHVHAAFESISAGSEPPHLGAPPTTSIPEGQAVAVIVARAPSSKTAAEAGLDAEWHRSVQAHGARVLELPNEARLCVLDHGKSNAIPRAAALVARTCQEHAFRASAIAGLLADGARDDLHEPRLAREIKEIAAIAASTPAGVVRFTARLADAVQGTVQLKPSGGSFVLAAAPAPTKPRRGRHGTLEIEVEAEAEARPPASRRRKTGEVTLEPAKTERGRANTLVMDAPERPARRKKGGTLEIELPADERQPTLEIETDPALQGGLTPQPTIEIPVDERLLHASKRGGTERGRAATKRGRAVR